MKTTSHLIALVIGMALSSNVLTWHVERIQMGERKKNSVEKAFALGGHWGTRQETKTTLTICKIADAFVKAS